MLHRPVFYALLCSWYCAASLNFPPTSLNFPADINHGLSLPTKRALIVAHGGASGMLPENTLPAFKLAVEQGADILECDVSLTRDLHLVCLDEPWLTDVTDVTRKFPAERKNTQYIPDIRKTFTDYFSMDFTLEELKTLKVKQRHDTRDYNHNNMYEIASLDEVLSLMKNSKRPLGVYVETKHPEWVNTLMADRNQSSLEQLLVDKLKSYGCSSKTDPCLIQSFSLESLERLKGLTSLPLVVLLDGMEVSDEELDEWSQFCYAIAPWKGLIVETMGDRQIDRVTELVQKAHKHGLKVHPFTFKNDGNMPWDYGQDPYQEYKHFLSLGVDGFFTDYPLTLSHFLNVTYRPTPSADKSCKKQQNTPSAETSSSYSISYSIGLASGNSSSCVFTLLSLFIALSMPSTYLR